MGTNVLITGGSGYLGGELLAHIRQAGVSTAGTIFALVRTDDQSAKVEKLGFSPIRFDAHDGAAIESAVVTNNISIVFWLIDAVKVESQLHFINALAKVKKANNREVHFLHNKTAGAKLFSSHAGAPTDRPLPDAQGLYEIQKNQKAKIDPVQQAVNTNNTIIERATELGVRSYIFIPCIVYGRSQGFGNQISIQTAAIVKAAKATGRMHRVDAGKPTWPVSHVSDTADLYLKILQKLVACEEIGYGKNGYYLAASGSVAWDDLYSAIAKELVKKGMINSSDITMADHAALEKMGVALKTPAEFVPVQLGGKCTLEAKHGQQIGWRPQFSQDHIVQSADTEVDQIINYLSL